MLPRQASSVTCSERPSRELHQFVEYFQVGSMFPQLPFLSLNVVQSVKVIRLHQEEMPQLRRLVGY